MRHSTLSHGSHPRRLLIAVCGLALLLGAPGLFAQATTPIYDIQSQTDPWGDSNWQGEEVTIEGTVTATFFIGFVVADGPGPWESIFVYSYRDGPEVGDAVQLTGTVFEYWGMTQIEGVTSFVHLSSGNPVQAVPVPLSEVGHEQWESVLITVQRVTVADLLDWGEWAVSDGTDVLVCGQLNDYMYFPQIDDRLDALSGVLFYGFGDFFLEPRFTADVVSERVPHYALHGHVVTMNDDRDVVVSGYVEIEGDTIVAIHSKRPKGLPIFQAGGLIFPGLIDAHNHPVYNVLGPIPFETTFEERYEWQATDLNAAFSDQRRDILHHGASYANYLNILKLAEVRALVAGTTTIQGMNCNGYYDNDFAHQGVIIDNLERFPARVVSSTFPLRQSVADWEEARAENWDRFVIHLAEGTNQASLEEFYAVYFMGWLDDRVTIIHGVPLGATEFSAMGQAGASLVWSPVSNLALYGATADIPAALAAGVNVALAPDWTPSGSFNLLDEMRAADAHDNAEWGDVLDAEQLVTFVTRNAALAGGVEHLVGQIAPGHRANLMVVPGSPKKPYKALLKAEPKNVKLTVVNGRPLYGNLGTLARFGLMDGVEQITLGGHQKDLAVTFDGHGIPESDKPFLEVLAELEEAYDASDPKVCDFAGLE